MRFKIFRTDSLAKKTILMFQTNSQELMEMMYRDYVKFSNKFQIYEIIEDLRDRKGEMYE
jgi:hypothetical protein